LAVYRNDIMLAAISHKNIDQIKADIGKQFHMKDLGKLHYFLGVSVNQS